MRKVQNRAFSLRQGVKYGPVGYKHITEAIKKSTMRTKNQHHRQDHVDARGEAKWGTRGSGEGSTAQQRTG